jgi:hypothetical protein
MQRYSVSKDDVMELARAAGENGIGTADIEGLTIEQAWEIITRLVGAGQLFKGKAGHRTLRYFTTQAGADAYSAYPNASRASKARPAAAPRQRWHVGAQAHYPTHPDGSPAYKITLCPPCRIGEGRLVRNGFGVSAVFA